LEIPSEENIFVISSEKEEEEDEIFLFKVFFPLLSPKVKTQFTLFTLSSTFLAAQ